MEGEYTEYPGRDRGGVASEGGKGGAYTARREL